MLRSTKSYQRLVTQIGVMLDGSAVAGGTLTTTGILMGSQHVLVSETGNGAYTITLNDPGSRACFAVASGVDAGTAVRIVSTTASTVAVEQFTTSTGAAVADKDVYILINKFDSADET